MGKEIKRILYGGDYNPNQWPKEVWKEDMRIFKDARINSATINVFSWAKIQPSEETYDFSELDEIIEMLSKEDYDIVLATSTGALPAWMARKYPEVERVDYEGRRHKFGQRHNACPNSEVFRKYSVALAAKLAERYASNPHVKCWHVSNEYGGTCYCENCEKAFRIWLRKKYGTLDAVNKAWNTEFWGHTFYDWEEIVAPNSLSEGLWDERSLCRSLHRATSGSILTACFRTTWTSGTLSGNTTKRPSSPQTSWVLIKSWTISNGQKRWISSPGTTTRPTTRPGVSRPCATI